MYNGLIQWPKASWWTTCHNPTIGCRKCSPACKNCWAEAWAKRFHQTFEPHAAVGCRLPRKGIIFMGSLTDLFGDWIPEPRLWQQIAETLKYRRLKVESHYIWLTKRVERMCSALHLLSENTRFPESACRMGDDYFGFTAENQEWYEKRMSVVNERFPEWANLWISAEPLLGPIDFRWDDVVSKPEVVIVGCESGPNRRPCKIEWVESIVEQCRTANIPMFVKQISLNNKCVSDINEFPAHLRIRQVPWAETNKED